MARITNFGRVTFPQVRRGLVVAVVLIRLSSGVLSPGADPVAVANPVSDIDGETLFQTDPVFREPQDVIRISENQRRIWLQALGHSEVELRIRAAEAIALAYQRGAGNMDEAVPHLIAAMDSADGHPLLRMALVRTLIVLNAAPAADILMRQIQSGGVMQAEIAELAEPALAAWGFARMNDIWLERLSQDPPSGRPFVLAVRAAGTVRLKESASRLRELVGDRTAAPDLRLECARALVRIQPEGLDQDVRQILAGTTGVSRVDALVAGILLSRATQPNAQALLRDLAAIPEPAVLAMVLERLLETSPLQAEPLNERIAVHRDTRVRQLAVRILAAQQTVAAVALLGKMLDDRHPHVRRTARLALVALDEIPALSPAVRQVTAETLAGDRAPGLEQATLLAGGVRHEAAASRLTQLLDFPDPDVGIAAAWSLRRLLIPETAPAILDKLKRQTKEYPHAPPQPDWDEKLVARIYRQRGHLIEALALLQQRDAAPLLLEYLPTPPVPPGAYPEAHELRVQAIWALGHLYEDDPQPDIVARLQERLASPDDTVVRGKTLIQAMAAVSLARMQSTESVGMLRGMYTPGEAYTDLRYGCAWGVHRLTAEPLADFEMIREKGYPASFLDALDH